MCREKLRIKFYGISGFSSRIVDLKANQINLHVLVCRV